MEPICSNIKKIQKTETPKKKFLIFQEAESFSPLRENFLYFKKRNFLIFQETELCNISRKVYLEP